MNKSVSWILAHLEQFSFAIESDIDRQLALMKPFSELLLAVSLIDRHDPYSNIGKQIYKWAWNKVEQGNVFTRFLIARPDLYQLSLPMLILEEAGFINPISNEVLKNIFSSRAFLKYEAEEWVNISVLYTLDKKKIRALAEKDFCRTWLFAKPEPWLINTNSIYALTHEIFYITDFGSRKDLLNSSLVNYIECWGPAWIEYYFDIGDFDVVCELIIVAVCLGLSWKERYIANFLDKQHHDGSFLGPERAGIQLIKSFDPPERQNFLRRYHTTLVAAILAAMASPREQSVFQ